MATDKVIHFGQYVRRLRVERGATLREFGELVGVTETRMNAIEKMEKPKVYDTTRANIARVAGMTLDEFDHAWQNTAVRPIRRKGGRLSRSGKSEKIESAAVRIAQILMSEDVDHYELAELLQSDPVESAERSGIKVLSLMAALQASLDKARKASERHSKKRVTVLPRRRQHDAPETQQGGPQPEPLRDRR